ncbi:MAG: bluetail domain-containing putative surface protein [Acidovorax sp.]
MPVQIFGAYADVTMLNRAFNDQSPSHNVYVNQVAAVVPIGITAFAQRFGAGFTALTEDALSTKLLMNLSVLPNAGLQTALRDYLVSVGKANVGIVALQLGRILSGLENATGDLSVYAAAAVKWNEEVTASHAYSSNPANSGPIVPPGPDLPVGVTLSLTADVDAISPLAAQAKFKTTAYNDTIVATTAGFLSSADSIDGAGGVDTLRATLAAGATVAPMLQSVERVFIQAGANSKFGVSGATGITELWRESAAGPAEFDGVDLATTVGIRSITGSGGSGALTVVFAGTSGGADTANLVLFRAAGNDEVIVDAVENLNVRSQGFSSTDGAANTARITANAAEKIVLTGEQALKTTVVGAQVSVIDASALTGALSLAFATTQKAVTITGGRGPDTFVINDASGAQVIVAAGEGGDTITIGAGNAHRITLGGGADTLNLTGLAGAAAKDLDTSFSTGLGWSAIVVTDFVSGTDRLVLAAETATAKATPTSLQLAGISDASSLLDATALAATTAGANKAIVFRYGADTYILVNDAVATLNANDSLVKLAGVSSLADASWASA